MLSKMKIIFPMNKKLYLIEIIILISFTNFISNASLIIEIINPGLSYPEYYLNDDQSIIN